MTSDYDISIMKYPSIRLKQDFDMFFMQIVNMVDDESYVPWFAFLEWDSIIEQSLGNKNIRLIIRDKNDKSVILATACFTLIKSVLFGNRLTSIGFFTGGSILWLDENALEAAIIQANDIAKSLGVDYIEFKDINFPQWIIEKYNLQISSDIYASFTKKLTFDSPAELLLEIPRKKRADIRKALDNNNLSFRQNISIDEFYNIYSISQRNLGTPVQGKYFFITISNKIPSAKLWGVYYNNDIMAVCMSFEHNQHGLLYYAGALPEARIYHAYDFMYFNIMLEMQKNGREYIDFGRSKYNTGAFAYKTYWNFTQKPISHIYMGINKSKNIVPLNPLNEKYSRKIAIWKKLPLWFSKIISYFIIGGLG